MSPAMPTAPALPVLPLAPAPLRAPAEVGCGKQFRPSFVQAAPRAAQGRAEFGGRHRLTVHRPGARALDLGTGSGVQALVLARQAGSVTATDVNPRALDFVRFNAALNQLGNVLPQEGSWFGPVQGSTFDAIVSNPPYVISPDAAYTYRDAGLARDTVSRMVVTEAARHLPPGGIATVLCKWAHDDSWADPLNGGRAC